MNKQRTIKAPVQYSGTGLHTGNLSCLTFKPADINTGVKFIRTDQNPPVTVQVDVEFVVDTVRGTTLGHNNTQVHTVEHVLSALSGLGIDNLIIELNANEPPVGDGSSVPFVKILQQAGVVEQDAPKKYFTIKEPVWLSTLNDAHLVVLPDDEFRVSYTVDYNNKNIKTQYASFTINDGIFERDIAPARTFCLLSEVEILQKNGLIKGGNLENTVVIAEDTILNDNLRFDNEYVRHKILDLIGDLYLLGQPLKAHVLVIKSGHDAHISLVKRLRQYAQEKSHSTKQITNNFISNQTSSKDYSILTPLDINQIQEILPHRYPFLFVDRILKLENDHSAVGIKNVSMNETYFEGHFPAHPIMPGVLIIEAMAQVAGVLLLSNPLKKGKLAYLLGVHNAKFRHGVIPGDQIRFEVKIIKLKERTGKVQGFAFVDDKIVAEAELIFSLVNP